MGIADVYDQCEPGLRDDYAKRPRWDETFNCCSATFVMQIGIVVKEFHNNNFLVNRGIAENNFIVFLQMKLIIYSNDSITQTCFLVTLFSV